MITDIKSGLLYLSACFTFLITREKILFFVAMYIVSVLLKCFKYAKDKMDFKSFAVCQVSFHWLKFLISLMTLFSQFTC